MTAAGQTSPARSALAAMPRPLDLSVLTRLAREPLVAFAAIGALILVVSHAREAATDPHRILVTHAQVERLAEAYAAQYGGPPAPAQMDQLIQRYADDEVFYREGVAQGLGRDDEIVRRRIIQKAQFLLQDTAPPAEPTAAQLRAFYAAHPKRYAQAPALAFSHIFFSADQGDAAARARALGVLGGLSDTVVRAPERGDGFVDAYDHQGFSPTEAARLFGAGELSAALFKAPVGRWSGPYRSAFGWHLVRVQSFSPGGIRPFEAARDQVRADVLAADQAARNARAFAQLKARYRVERLDAEPPP